VPDVPASTQQIYRALHQAIKKGLVRSAHDLSEGGPAVAAAEMCIGGRLGMQLDIEESSVFTEANGCLLVEVSRLNATVFESHFENLSLSKIGEVTSALVLKINADEITVNDLVHSFSHPNQSLVSNH
jgi:phosphoribosylformylglycinamidine synthase